MERTVIRSKHLASLLAQEDLQVEFSRTADTPYFDAVHRRLVLPVWRTNNHLLVDSLIVHEVGHALHSDELNKSLPTTPEPAMRPYITILDDCRVDRLQRENYPGTKKDYYEGYKALLELDIFELDKYPVKDMILIDRINMQSKLGQYISVPFYNDEERSLLHRAFTTETPEDVIALAADVRAYDERVYGKDYNASSRTCRLTDDSGASQGEAESGKADNGEADSGEADSGEAKSGKADNGEADSGEAKSGEADSGEADSGEADSGEADSGKAKSGKVKTGYDGPLAPVTADALNRWESENALKEVRNKYVTEYQIYLTIGAEDPSKVLADGVEWRKLVTERVRSRQDSDIVRELQVLEKKWSGAVAALQKEFSIWKQANTSSELRTNRGSLDVNRLHLYRINDNIFTKSIISNRRDQNHRIVFILDISSSMLKESSLTMVMDQLLIFRRFCLREGIKFNVITYTTMNVCVEVESSTWLRKYKAQRDLPLTAEERDKYWSKRYEPDAEWASNYERALCVDILNELDDDKWFATLYKFMTALSFECRTDWWNPMLTPTNETLNLVYCWLHAVRKTMRQDKLSLVVLTDGESTDYNSIRSIVKDVIGYTQMTEQDLLAPLMKNASENTRNRLSDFDKLFVEFLILKAMKDNGIVDSIVWYNLCHSPFDATRCDLYQLVEEKLWREVGIKDDCIKNRRKDRIFSEKLCEGGMLCFDAPLPWIDKFFIYIPLDLFDNVINQNSRIRNQDKIIVRDFTRERKKKAVMKTLIASVAKCIA